MGPRGAAFRQSFALPLPGRRPVRRPGYPAVNAAPRPLFFSLALSLIYLFMAACDWVNRGMFYLHMLYLNILFIIMSAVERMY